MLSEWALTLRMRSSIMRNKRRAPRVGPTARAQWMGCAGWLLLRTAADGCVEVRVRFGSAREMEGRDETHCRARRLDVARESTLVQRDSPRPTPCRSPSTWTRCPCLSARFSARH